MKIHCDYCGKEFRRSKKKNFVCYYYRRYNVKNMKVCDKCYSRYKSNGKFERLYTQYPIELRQKMYKKKNQISWRVGYKISKIRNEKQKHMPPEDLLKLVGYKSS